MKESEITSLAREYAEEIYGKELSNTLVFNRDKDKMEANLRWLLHRYALVEKERVKDEYHEAKFTCGNVDPFSETFVTSLAQKSMLERLLPEIGKEVE